MIMKTMQTRSANHFFISALLTGLLALILSMPVAADVRARLDRDKVYVALRGTCSDCRVSRFTLKGVVEQKLRDQVAETIEVEQVSG